MRRLLIIDDEPSVRMGIEAVFDREDVAVFAAETADAGLRLAAEQSPDVILLDIRLGQRSGLELFHELRRLDPKTLVIFITGHGTTETAIEAMKLGAYDYLTKPLDADQLQAVVEQAFAISRLMHVPAIIEDGDRPEDQADRLIGSGAAMQRVCKQIGRIAPRDVNVLIRGESGTGKELVARAIYQHSPRAVGGRFLAVNCRPSRRPYLESELFGHRKATSPGPTASGSASSNNAPAARSSWTRWATWPRTRRPRFCDCCKKGVSSDSAAVRALPCRSASWPPRTRT